MDLSAQTAAPPLPPTDDDIMGGTNAIWILMTAYFVFTMQIGFVLLEVGCLPLNYRGNAYYKGIVDVLANGMVYWILGYGFAFGKDYVLGNQFVGVGDFALDVKDYGHTGYVFVNYVFQMSFASSGTTIVAGVAAGRMRMYSYISYCMLFAITYSIVSHWLWSATGFLHFLGAVDASGSGVVHLCGGTGALATGMMLGPRTGRFDPKAPEPEPSKPCYIIFGTFVLWWGWMGFNSGGAFGITGGVWKVAARAAVTTAIAGITGGIAGIILSKIKKRNLKTYDVADACNGVLGGLVAITAGCTVVRAWEASIIGGIAAIFTTWGGSIVLKCKIDDPIGAIPVHFMNGAWGLIAVGLFMNNDPYTFFNLNGVVGLFNGGGFYSIGIQALAVICIIAWTAATTFLPLVFLKTFIGITLSDEEQIQGPDYAEHGIQGTLITKADMSNTFPTWRTAYDGGYDPTAKDEAGLQRRKQLCTKPDHKADNVYSDNSSVRSNSRL